MSRFTDVYEDVSEFIKMKEGCLMDHVERQKRNREELNKLIYQFDNNEDKQIKQALILCIKSNVLALQGIILDKRWIIDCTKAELQEKKRK